MAHRKALSQEMFEHVARQRESGMTVVNYAKHTGITTSKLQYWIRKLNAKEAGKNSLKFIDLSSFDTADHHSRAPEPQSNPQITLTFPNGMCLKI
ncbi:MAG TPA: hypothetical protein VE912_01530 [Bacteroidales bacterium]|nr:hypothetical protein [Bacteroidales bacterium]